MEHGSNCLYSEISKRIFAQLEGKNTEETIQ